MNIEPHPSSEAYALQHGYTREHALDSVGKGWSGLINGIYDYAESHKVKMQVSQVKEKFGTLRFYYTILTPTVTSKLYSESIDETLARLVDSAEYYSGYICESCGKPGKLNPSGWYRTLCEECSNITK